jgi:16S rRNA (uracil1498-N3)-methyltransferase
LLTFSAVHLFYTPDIQLKNDIYFLSEEESKHCIKVLRLKLGDEVILINGQGGWFKAKITDAHPKRTVVTILSVIPNFNQRNHYLHIGIAPTKNIERLEWFLEKATEIGIDEITPILCAHSERRDLKIERLSKRITAAMNQSLKAYHPKLNPLTSFGEFVQQVDHKQKFIAHCMEGEKPYLKDILIPSSSCTILIGPEGDFSPTEVQQASQFEFMPISLGEARLRTETAALAACFEVNFLNR